MKRFGWTVLGTTALWLCIAEGAGAAILNPEEYAKPNIDLGCTITTDKGQYQIGEPVYVTFHLTSFSPQVLELNIEPILQYDLRLYTWTPRTSKTQIKQPVPQTSTGGEKTYIMPFETLNYTVKVLLDPDDSDEDPILVEEIRSGDKVLSRIPHYPHLVFDHESWFRISADLNVTVNTSYRARPTVANVAQIEVKSPPSGSPEDKILTQMALNGELMRAYQLLVAGAKERKFFEQALADFPNSRYTPEFLYILGNSYSSSQEDLEKALGYFQRLNEEYPDSRMILPALQKMSAIYTKLEQVDRAMAIFRQILQENPSLWENLETTSVWNEVYGDLMFQEYNENFWMLTPEPQIMASRD